MNTPTEAARPELASARITIDEHGTHTHGITASFELITPTEAAEILDSSDFTNRPLRSTVVERYTEAMSRNEWKLAPEPLVITDKGQLIQGQHRLSAVIASDTNQWFMVVRGWRTDVFDVLDSGVKRSVSDVLVIGGNAGPNGGRIAAAAKLLVGLNEANVKGVSPHNALKRVKDRQQVITYAEEHAEALSWAYSVVEPLYRAKVLNVPPSSLVAAATIIHFHGNDRLLVEDFFSEMLSLTSVVDPRWALVRWKMTNKSKSGKAEMSAAIVVKAWNAWVRNVRPMQFAWRIDEEFPTPLTVA